ncbi:unnamed protein product [Cylicocyclus nassatus]|uniref:RING-type domain-containing protein n=1 Tax=Cylicocyclus nassatus TaxID=53992 RepID=A0AA36DSW1_CYLNA|nr:unnamed protein product [Cylicocyclus nassatus]
MEPSSSSTTTAATSAEVQPPVPTHFFTELFTLDHLVMTSSSSKRSRLTCIAVSPHFLFLGTSTGGVSAYSRYASARKRIKSPSGPYHFINTKDGPVSTLCVNLQEGLVAVGNDSGRVHIVSFSASSPSPIIQTLTKDTRKLDKVTSLVWSEDAKKLYSGHANGVVMAYHLGTKSPFRTACTVLATFSEGEILQLDVSGSQLLISTQLATYVYDLEEKTTTQVGKKPRSGRMGACFFPMSGSSSQVDNSAFVLAARPNGRVWEANTAGVVYRTHQLRENSAIPRPPIISSRTDYSCDMTLVSSAAANSNEDVQLGVLHRLDVDGNSFILSSSGSKMIVFDVDQSKIILVNELEEEIQCLCVCAADVFVIFRNLPIPRKYTLCDREMVVKKLLAKSLAVQSAQFVLSWKACTWPDDVLNHIAESLSKCPGKANVERLRAEVMGLLEQQKSELHRDTKAIVVADSPVCVRLPSGIHRVVNKISEPLDEPPSEADALPRRKRYRSRSCAATRTSSTQMPKRKSFPQIILSEKVKRIRESRSEIVSSESLRTLLQLRSRDMLDAVKFVPTITIGNAAKSLAALAIATPINFSCLVPAEGRKVTDDGRKAVKRRSGPSIVKAVRPCKTKPVASVRPLLSRRSVKPLAAVPTDEDRHNNCENSNDIKLPSAVSETTTECVIAYNDGENNVDLNLVMDRLTQIQIQNVTNDNAPINGTPHIEEIVEPPPAPSSSSDCCEECKIHRSWPAAAMLAKVCRRVKINKNQFSFGAVPSLHSDWKQLLEFRFTTKQSNTSPCARCETAVCSCLSIFGQGSTLLDFVPEKVRPNPKTILERCTSIDEDRMSRILFEESASSPSRTADEVQLSNNSSTATLTNGSPAASPSKEIPRSKLHIDEHLTPLSSFEWLLALDARVVFAIASLVLGYQELISLIKESQVILHLLLPEHWSALSLLGVREQAMKKDRISAKVITDVLQEFNLSNLISVEPYKASPAKRDGLYKQTPMYSWIIDCNSSCLICTLSLKSDVSNKDLAVTSFICGHSYHTVCLIGRSGGCLACRMRMRNANARRTSQPSKS